MTAADDRARAYPFSYPSAMLLDPTYATLRRSEPVSQVRLAFGGEAWLVTRYADIKSVLADPRFSRAATADRDVPRSRPQKPKAVSILAMDPPEHTRIRHLIAAAFTRRRVESLRDRTRLLADDLVDQMTHDGPPRDLVTGLALPLPITVLLELLGVPAVDHDRLRNAADCVMGTTGYTSPTVARPMPSLTAVRLRCRRLVHLLGDAREAGQQRSGKAAHTVCPRSGLTEPNDLLVLCGQPGQGLAAEVDRANRLRSLVFSALSRVIWASRGSVISPVWRMASRRRSNSTRRCA
ncbi:hypothetical protein GCM10018785_46420 [Streptomyces longispororuber]|uniref:Cytochrome P450 n=1 Tax=Streptomyces longispororuber TaxID=68230 RepID=A0A919DRQ7_9ACTN|nr:hypothetical protein GCM10018785_46420 [Streptomyces longispororuber]